MDRRGQSSPPCIVLNHKLHQHLHLNTSKLWSQTKGLKSWEAAPCTEDCGCGAAFLAVSPPAFVREKRLPGHANSGGTGRLQLVGSATPSPSPPSWLSIRGLILLAGLSRFGPIEMAGLLEVSLLVAACWPVCWTRAGIQLRRKRLATSNSSATQREQEHRVNKTEVAHGQLPIRKWHEARGKQQLCCTTDLQVLQYS